MDTYTLGVYAYGVSMLADELERDVSEKIKPFLRLLKPAFFGDDGIDVLSK